MVVLKTGRSMGELVFIDSDTTGDMDKVPDAVKQALSSQSGPIPKVALSDATGAKVYGTASHTELKGGLAAALKDAKRAMREDQNPKGGIAPKTAAPAAKSGSSETPAETTPASVGDPVVTEKNGSKEVTGAPLEQWTSSKGTSITARLTKVAGTKVTLVTDKGKPITLGQAELAPASYQRLQEILSAK
jgi:hypothetical protein